MSIAILTAGGTIDKVYFDANSEFAVGDPQIARVLADANVQVDYTIETVHRKDSLDLTEEDRDLLVQRAREIPQERILITHGTDTMAETARAMLGVAGKTIVLVGSLSPARMKASDAEFNVGFALAAVQTLPAGAYVAMNGCLFPAADVRKNRDQSRFERSSQ